MPKIIELTVEIVIQKVTCPGVWLCQDGFVSLIVFALGTSYETCMLPPTFPLLFNDKLYFRKRFQETCSLNDICCLLKGETLYCELVQWCESCASSECKILAQYLGPLSEVLFPPKMCCNDGVDLLMRRSKKYPGILAPKIEITTKVRIDEVWNGNEPMRQNPPIKIIPPCKCPLRPDPRQKPVCHSAGYHRKKCQNASCPKSRSRSRSGSRSRCSGSCSSLREAPDQFCATRSDQACKSGGALNSQVRGQDYCVYNVEVPKGDHAWNNATGNSSQSDVSVRYKEPEPATYNRDTKIILESLYVDDEEYDKDKEDKPIPKVKSDHNKSTPCVCEICRRYHELFHANS